MVVNDSGYDIKISVQTSIAFVTFTSLQILIGSVANFVVIITIVASKELRRRSEDRLILNLAVADFLALTVFLPMHTYVLGERYITINFLWFCEFLNGLILATGGNTIVAIGIDTFIAVVFPLRHKEVMTKTATSVMIISSWTIATGIAIVHVLVLSSMVDKTTGTLLLITYVSIQLFGIAMLYIVIFYCTLRQGQAILNERRKFAAERGHRSPRLVMKSALTTLGMAFLYHATYLPLAIFFVYFRVEGVSAETRTNYFTWIYTFLYINSCINPFAYALRTTRFKTAFRKKIWSKVLHGNKRPQSSFSN